MNSENQSIKQNLADKALLLYESQPWFRALVQAVPFVGGSADTMLAWRAVHLNKVRIDNLFNEVSQRLSQIEEAALNNEFIQSEEFFEILRSCAEAAARTASEYKRKRVADFLAGTIKTARIHDLSQQIAEDLNVLQDFHLHILALIPQHLKHALTSTDVSVEIIDIHTLQNSSGFDWGIFSKGISDLERLGFLSQDSVGMTFEEGSIMVRRTTKYLSIFRESLTA
jgi:hypothetical protein